MPPAHRPQRIILVRHGESEGNIDDRIYETVPDHALHLTERGREQVIAAGERIRALVGEETLRMWVSPYTRTLETAALLGLGVPADEVRLEPRLREQDWANFQDPAKIAEEKRLRNDYGHFWYRFSHGESGSDVYDRVSTFLESLHRNFDDPAMERNVVIVTHGLTMRLFCMRWFHWSVDYFESICNPPNGTFVVLDRQPDNRYKLLEPFEQWDQAVVPTARERNSWL
ncbi:histidine phosphatase family protein [Enemella dayhoffiae]|uniref:Histidine phosphatase family protein n=1 Tax=Enemella dayhoffiae TaxID=2016507 RepID=A0A255HBZ8_9ACTN|nr:histidine phosphatase family protein [Enemella dayhoffiae]OYO25289.1 histidine phosphatase family protein [Enemella dayhoffiae]